MNYLELIVEAAGATIERTADKQRRGRFTVRVIQSPAGFMPPEAAVAVEYDDKQLQAEIQQLEAYTLDQAGMVAFGRKLAALLLPPRQGAAATGVRELFAASLTRAGQDQGLRLRLRLPAQLAALPWEYLYVDPQGGGEGMDGFLALDKRIALVRDEALAPIAEPPLSADGLKVVVALAAAEWLPPLDLAKERAGLQQAFDQQPGIAPVFLEDATLPEIQAAIDGAAIFHFAGHGAFNRQPGDAPGTYTGSGTLALYDANVHAEQLGINLRSSGVRLAVLGGCETGRRDGVNVWSGIAPALVKVDVPAVVANQFQIQDECAIAFSRSFYTALVGGLPLEQALAAGRIAAYNADPTGIDWGIPVLYLRAADGQLFVGADDQGVREQAQQAAMATIELRLEEVAAGATARGAAVGQMRRGRLGVNLDARRVAGTVEGAAIKQMSGGELLSDTTVGTVAEGGSVTGVTIESLD